MNYSEEIWRVPHAWSTRYRQSTPGLSRHRLGLPENGVLFCCFNRAEKITPKITQIWFDILHAVKGSWLWLAVKPTTLQRLQALAAEHGVAPERLTVHHPLSIPH